MLLKLQHWLTAELQGEQAVYECVDCTPLRAYSCAQGEQERQHWLWESQKGHGGTHGGWYWGDKLLLSVTQTGIITGWILGSAN